MCDDILGYQSYRKIGMSGVALELLRCLLKTPASEFPDALLSRYLKFNIIK